MRDAVGQAPPMALEIRAVESKKELETFLHVPWTLGMKQDPLWVPPLLDDHRRLLNPKKSPFLKHGEAQCFLALDGGQPVGRISAQTDADFDKQWPGEKGVSFFGFFDSKDDPAVARALLDKAAEWARAHGRSRLRGPFTLDSKGDTGVLIDGFDTPPRIGMPHNRPYVGPLIESAGFAKAKDFYAMSAFFADIRQWGVYNDYGYTPNPDLKGWSNDHPFPPEIEIESEYQTRQITRLRNQLRDLCDTVTHPRTDAYWKWKKESAKPAVGTHAAVISGDFGTSR